MYVNISYILRVSINVHDLPECITSERIECKIIIIRIKYIHHHQANGRLREFQNAFTRRADGVF